jgi:acyl-coenzyme A thioesterase PaaI-like protein
MTHSDLQSRLQAILDVPLNRHLGLVFEEATETAGGAVAHARFDVQAHHLAFGGLHGGVLYALMDAVSMLALLPALAPAQHAVTHDLHASMMCTAQAHAAAVGPGAQAGPYAGVHRSDGTGRRRAGGLGTGHEVDHRPNTAPRLTRPLPDEIQRL